VAPVFRHSHFSEDTGSVDRVLTIPNGISAARLAGVPVFLWLVFLGAADRDRTARLLGGRPAHPGRAVRLAGRQDRPCAEPDQPSRPGARPGPRTACTSRPRSSALGVRAIIPLVAGRRPGAARADGRRSPGRACGGGPGSAPCRSASSAKAATLCLLYAFPLAVSWRSPRLGRDAGPGTRLGVCDLGNRPVLVGRDAVFGPGQGPLLVTTRVSLSNKARP